MQRFLFKPNKFFLISYSLFLLIFFILSIYFYFNEKNNHNLENRKHLQTLAKIKSEEITRWYEERNADASFLYSNIFFKNILSDYLTSSSKEDSLRIFNFMEKMFKNHDYKDILVFNRSNKKILSFSDIDQSYDPDSLASAIKNRRITFSNFYLNPKNGTVDLDIFIPIYNNNDLLSIIIMKIDPEKLIFPLIQNWYVPKSSAESFIVYRRGEEVVFINKLKFTDSPPLTFRRSVKSPDLPAALAVSGVKGIVEGVDYRGEKVLADIRRIKDTPWFLITKQDLSEIYLPVTTRLSFILLLLFTVSAIGGITFLYVQSRLNYKNSLRINESTKKFELLYQSINDAIVIIEENRIFNCNGKAEKIFNIKEKDLIGKSLDDFSPEVQLDGNNSSDKLRSIINEVLQGEPRIFEWFFKIENSELFCRISFSPLAMEDKKYIVAIIHDLTETRRIEDQNLRLLYAIRQSPASIIITNIKGEIEYTNPKFTEITGYSSEEVIGKNPRILKSGELTKEVYANLWKTILSGSEWRGEFHNKKKNGELFWERASISPIKNSFGIITNFIAIKEDITSAKEAEESLKKMAEELLEQNKYLEQFANIISHNLRAPVANIIGIVNTLKDPELSEKDRAVMMDGLSFSAKKLDELIDDLSNIIQVKRGAEAKKENIYLSQLLNDISNSISGLIKNERADIKSDFSEIDQLTTIKSYIHSIFYNLILNSIKYKQPALNPVIEIKSRKHNSKIEISFKDNGLGIDLKNKGDQVFGLYKRFHNNIDGKGMGLFMTKMQVESLGGKINIKSEVNKGTEFIISFYY